jgi:hypothetical protein
MFGVCSVEVAIWYSCVVSELMRKVFLCGDARKGISFTLIPADLRLLKVLPREGRVAAPYAKPYSPIPTLRPTSRPTTATFCTSLSCSCASIVDATPSSLNSTTTTLAVTCAAGATPGCHQGSA